MDVIRLSSATAPIFVVAALRASIRRKGRNMKTEDPWKNLVTKDYLSGLTIGIVIGACALFLGILFSGQ